MQVIFSSEEEELTGAVPIPTGAVPSPVRSIVSANSDAVDGELPGNQAPLSSRAVRSPVGSIVPANADDEQSPEGQITLGGIAPSNKKQILIMIVREGVSPGDLRLVCREWRNIIDEDTVREENTPLSYSNIGPCWQDCMRAFWGVTSEEEEEIFRIFLEGKLVYKPDPNSDARKKEFRIRDFVNPFGGTFPLSACGETDNFSQFTTDPSVFFAIDDENSKVNILIAPHFLINRYISTTTNAFTAMIGTIMGNWDKDKPVGIFWRWGLFDATDFDYLSSSSLDEISSRNMWENCVRARQSILSIVPRPYYTCSICEPFMFVCKPKLD